MSSLGIQKNLLQGYLRSMHEEGIVNDQFYNLQNMKNETRPDFVVRALTLYCTSTQTLFSQLTHDIQQPVVDFNQVNTHARELYVRSCCIGAEHVRVAVLEILRACKEYNKEHCDQALYWTKNEFTNARRKFETIVQMERRIIDLEMATEGKMEPTREST